MHSLYLQGHTAAHIAHLCAAGSVSVAPFVIPRRTVLGIVTAMARERGQQPLPERADKPEWKTLAAHANRLDRILYVEIERVEAAQRGGKRLDRGWLKELTIFLKELIAIYECRERVATADSAIGAETAGKDDQPPSDSVKRMLKAHRKSQSNDTAASESNGRFSSNADSEDERRKEIERYVRDAARRAEASAED